MKAPDPGTVRTCIDIDDTRVLWKMEEHTAIANAWLNSPYHREGMNREKGEQLSTRSICCQEVTSHVDLKRARYLTYLGRYSGVA